MREPSGTNSRLLELTSVSVVPTDEHPLSSSRARLPQCLHQSLTKQYVALCQILSRVAIVASPHSQERSESKEEKRYNDAEHNAGCAAASP